jgi:iron complex outermembrane receptor protein
MTLAIISDWAALERSSDSWAHAAGRVPLPDAEMALPSRNPFRRLNALLKQESAHFLGGVTMFRTGIVRLSLLSLVSSLIITTYSRADAPSQAGATTDNSLQEIIVTGTFLPVTKQKATTAVSVVDAQEISKLVPTNALDLLTNVPGFFVDSSYGSIAPTFSVEFQTSDITSRGLPFVAIEEDGLPLEGANSIGAVLGSTALLRADTTLDQIQAVRGGSASITGANSPGGIIDYISKTGGDVRTLEMSASYGLQGDGRLPYERFDFNSGGPLAADGWYYNVGGFYQHDYGTKDAGFPLDYGGQLKANLVKKFSNGSIEIYGKYLNDHNGFSELIPAQNFNSPRPVPGWTNTSWSTAPSAGFSVLSGPNSYTGVDPQDLNHTVSTVIGVKFNVDMGEGWGANGNVRFSNNVESGAQNDFGIYDTLTDVFAYSFLGSAAIPGTYTLRSAASGGSAQVLTTDGSHFTVLNNNLPGTASVPNGVMGDGFYSELMKDNELQGTFTLTKKLDTMSFAVGTYLDHSDIHNTAVGVFGLGTLTPRPEMLDVSLQTPSGNVLQVTNPAGFSTQFQVGYNEATWQQISVYFSHIWNFADSWSLDWGVRHEHTSITAENIATSGPTTVSNSSNFYNNQYQAIDTFFGVGRAIDTLAYSAAVNYEFDKQNSIYFRYSDGKKAPNISVFEGLGSSVTSPTTPAPTQNVQQYELGYKLENRRISLEVTPFYSVLGVPGNQVLEGSGITTTALLYNVTTPTNKSRDYGVEVDGAAHLDDNFAVRAALTWQHATELDNYHYTQPNGPGPIQDAVLVDSNQGFESANVPDWMATITPSYTNGRFYAQLQWQYMGARAANNFDAWEIPAYQKTNMTVQWQLTTNAYVAFTVNNLFNGQGVTEWSAGGPYPDGLFVTGTYTKAQVAANPNQIFSILEIPARAYFARFGYKF